MLESFLIGVAGFIGAMLLSSFAEYFVHILMHRRVFLGKVHRDHHAEGTGQGWLLEFKDYFLPGIPVIIGLAAALYFTGWYVLFGSMIGGATFFAAFAAYAHQVQHEFPELAFWMRRPVHYIHHHHKMWHNNFGISMDIWDRIFGTYQVVEWMPERPIQFKRFFQIRWV
jgi:sterol desaturase/sphingolipid hydroxylase (fatty acid hydroxylase superfamily)